MLKNFSQRSRSRFWKPSSRELALFAGELKFLLSAGVPLMPALSIIGRQIPSKKIKVAIEKIKGLVSSGHSLSDSLKNDIFPDIFINIIAAGEAGGALDVSLSKIASYFDTKDDLRKKIISATIYPALVLSLSLASILFIAVYLIPTMNGVFSGLGIELPFITRMIGLSGETILRYWWLLLSGPVALCLALNKFLKARFGDGFLEKITLGLPLLGRIFHKMICGRVSSALSTLLGSGVPLISSLKVARAVSGNSVYREAFDRVLGDVERGEKLSEALRGTRVFPESFCELAALGEATGRLDSVFADLEGYYERDVELQLKVLTSLVEPLSTVLVGVAVGIIVFSIFLPLMNVVDALAK